MNKLKVRLESVVKEVRREFEERGFKKGVIGLSGGVDSAVSLAIAVRAIGKENVIAIRMPYKTSSPVHLDDATLVAKAVGLPKENLLTREITPMVDAFLSADLSLKEDRLRIGNVAARCRMITLFDIAKREKGLVIGTENKTENMFNYYTRYGDAASDIEPITAFYKIEVWEAAKIFELPESVITKDPSADLWPGQTDETEMDISYKISDPILKFIYDEGLGEKEVVAKGFSLDHVRRVVDLVESSKFKKELPVLIVR